MQNIAQSIFKYETTILYSFKIQISNNNKKNITWRVNILFRFDNNMIVCKFNCKVR